MGGARRRGDLGRGPGHRGRGGRPPGRGGWHRGRHRHHQPARDGGRLGPVHAAVPCTAPSCGRTGARPSVATSCAAEGQAPPGARADRARPRPLLLGHQDGVAARSRRRRRRRQPGARHGRRLAHLEPHRRNPTAASSPPTPRTRRAPCSTTSATVAGPTSCASSSASPPPPSPRSGPRAGVSGSCGARSAMPRPSLAGVPVSGVAGDQQAALFGQACVARGMAKVTYGTGSFVLLNVGERCPPPSEGLLTTVAWDLGEHGGSSPVAYALEGAVFVTGAAVQWLRDGLGLIEEAAGIGALAEQVDDSEGVFVVPAFTGLGSPWWDPYARGTITGLTRGLGAPHIARAVVEAMAYQVRDVVDAMTTTGTEVAALRVDGGVAVLDLLLQIQADQLRVPVSRPSTTETTALGAATLAGLAEGVWGTLDDLETMWSLEAQFTARATSRGRGPCLRRLAPRRRAIPGVGRPGELRSAPRRRFRPRPSYDGTARSRAAPGGGTPDSAPAVRHRIRGRDDRGHLPLHLAGAARGAGGRGHRPHHRHGHRRRHRHRGHGRVARPRPEAPAGGDTRLGRQPARGGAHLEVGGGGDPVPVASPQLPRLRRGGGSRRQLQHRHPGGVVAAQRHRPAPGLPARRRPRDPRRGGSRAHRPAPGTPPGTALRPGGPAPAQRERRRVRPGARPGRVLRAVRGPGAHRHLRGERQSPRRIRLGGAHLRLRPGRGGPPARLRPGRPARGGAGLGLPVARLAGPPGGRGGAPGHDAPDRLQRHRWTATGRARVHDHPADATSREAPTPRSSWPPSPRRRRGASSGAARPAWRTLEDCGAAPNFQGITAWLNTPGDRPLSIGSLKGKVVLVDFWTYSCINCQRSLPHVESWYARYHADGLEVVGVHTPEFAFEHVVSNVSAGGRAAGREISHRRGRRLQDVGRVPERVLARRIPDRLLGPGPPRRVR